MLTTFRGVCLICLCILGFAVIVALLELVAYPILLKLTGCSWTEGLQSFTCGDGWVGHSIAIVLNLPILFSYAQTFTLFGARQKPPHGLRASNKPELLGTTFERIGTALNHTVALVRGEPLRERNVRDRFFEGQHPVPSCFTSRTRHYDAARAETRVGDLDVATRRNWVLAGQTSSRPSAVCWLIETGVSGRLREQHHTQRQQDML